MLCTTLCVTLGSLSAQAADASPAEQSPDDFAFGANVLTSGEAAAYRASLPLAIYKGVVRGDLGDLRVFNERGEVVPYRIERPSPQSIVQSAPVSLPLFSLRGDPGKALDAIRVTIESGDARVDVQAPTSGTGSLPVASYVIDGRALTSPISSLTLAWADDVPDFAGRLRVEASDDLGEWRTVVTAAPIANLRANNARIIERRVELYAVGAKFWRLSWPDTPAPFEITAVTAEPSRDHVDVTRATLTVDGKPVAEKRGEFEYDMGARVPADRINLELPEQNSVVEVELLSRDQPTQPWRPVTRAGFYRLKSAGLADLTNGSIHIAPTTDRYWLARVDMRSGGLGRDAPKLRAGWIPHDLVFLARGAGPFVLAYGNATAHTLVPLVAFPASISILNATLAEPYTLGGTERLTAAKPPSTWWSKSTVLWTVLVVGVALLAVMAYRLASELKDKDKQ